MSHSVSKLKKIILVGDPMVGKTSLRKTYLGSGFSSNYMATIGADFSFATYQDPKTSENIKFSIWDIAGEQNYHSIRSQFYSGAHGVIIVFDISRPETLYNIDHWVAELKANMIGKINFLLVGNKEDLRNIEDNVTKDEEIERRKAMWEQILEIKIPLYFSSALTGLNVDHIFSDLLGDIF